MTRVENIHRIVLVAIPMALILASCSSATPEQTVVVVTGAPDEGATEATALPAEIPTAVPIAPTPGSGDPTLTAKVNTAVRSGPGSNYPVYAFMSGGQTATLAGTNESGTQYAIVVTVASTGTGWIDAQFADISNAGDLAIIEAPPPPPSTAFSPPAPGEPAVVAQESLFVRTGPGEQYPAYGTAEKGARGAVFGVDETLQWFTVRLDPSVVGKGHGWVRSNLVETENVDLEDLTVIEAPAIPDRVAPPEVAPGDPKATAIDYVNVRTGPSTNYPAIAMAIPGGSAGVSGKSADTEWWQVIVGTSYTPSGLAWVNAGYVVTENTENVPVVEAPPPPDVAPPPSGSTACALVSQSPTDGTIVAPGASFDMTWTLQNVGSTTWDENTTDVNFIAAAGGTRLSSTDLLDLTQSVSPGSTYSVVVSMMAPSSSGQYGETWSINENNASFCQFYNIIDVSQ